MHHIVYAIVHFGIFGKRRRAPPSGQDTLPFIIHIYTAAAVAIWYYK